MANELHSLSIGGTSYPVSPQKANPTSSTSTYYVIGTSSSTGAIDGSLYFNSSVKVQSGTTLYASGGFMESSDESLKTILKPISVNLEKLSKLRKVYFLWKEGNDTAKRQLGIIAQDVEKIYPELVGIDESTNKLTVAYDKLSVIALEGIDVLYQENKRLKEQLSIMENKCADLEEKFIDLEYKVNHFIENNQ